MPATITPTTTQTPNLQTLKGGDYVDLGAAGKYIKGADGSYKVQPSSTDPNLPPTTPKGTTAPSAVISSSGARDAVGTAASYIAQNTPQTPQNQNNGSITPSTAQQNANSNPDPKAPANNVPGGPAINPDGSKNPYAAPENTDTSKTTTASSNPEFDTYKANIDAQNTQLQQDAADFKTKSDAIVARMDSANATLIGSITKNYADLIQQQKTVNDAYVSGVTQSGIRGGQQRYAPEDYGAEIRTEMNAGIDRVAKLEGERDKLIADAQNASAKQDWDVYYQTYQELQKNRDAQNKNVQDLYDKSQTLKEKAQQAATTQLDNLSKTQTLQKNTIDSLANYADVHLQDLEKAKDTQGAADFITQLADQYGIDKNELLSKVEAVRQANKGWSAAYVDKTTGQQVQRNLQTGEVRVIYTPTKSNGGVQPSGNVTTIGGRGVVAGGTKVDPTIAEDVQSVLEGRNTLYNIRQTMGRTNAAAAYMQSMRHAITQIDPNFDFVASDAGGKFVSSTFYQKAITAITSVEPNIDKAVQLSDQVQRVGIKGVDAMLQNAKMQFGDTKVSNFHEAQKLIADEIGLALGQGSVSDMKLQLGFDVTDPSVTPEVFASNMKLVKDFIDNRKKALTDQRYKSSTTDTATTPTTSSGATTQLTGPDGKLYDVPNDKVDAFKKAGGH